MLVIGLIPSCIFAFLYFLWLTHPFTLAAYLFETQFEPNTSVDNNAVLQWLLVVSVKLKVQSVVKRLEHRT